MRETVLAAAHARLQPSWTTVNGMRVPVQFPTEGNVRDLALVDVSCFAKAGIKGPRAAGWLGEHGIPVPPRANTWTGDLIARLGETEFFLEGDVAREIPGSVPPSVYPVLRQDVAIALAGARISEVLLQTCSVNLAAMDRDALVMTSMAGVPVLVISQQREGFALTRIWADPSFGPYLWESLLEIVQQLGGRPAGIASLFSELQPG